MYQLDSMEKLERRLEEHMVSDEKNITHILQSIDKIKDNHLAHIQESMAGLEVKYQSLVSDIAWLKWGLIAILLGIIGSYFKQ